MGGGAELDNVKTSGSPQRKETHKKPHSLVLQCLLGHDTEGRASVILETEFRKRKGMCIKIRPLPGKSFPQLFARGLVKEM